MKCPNCDNEVSDGAKFCNHCGSKIEVMAEEIKTEEVSKKIDFDEGQTEIIFDKKLPKDKLNKGSKTQTIITFVICGVIAIGAVVAVLMMQNTTKKTIAAQQQTGIETNERGEIVYNKGNKEYAHDELIDEGSDTYYFKEDGTMLKGDWASYKGKYYFCGNDGKVLKNTWIEDTYYVNEFGEMLINSQTPDGYFVGADGKYISQEAIDAAKRKESGGSSGGGGGTNGTTLKPVDGGNSSGGGGTIVKPIEKKPDIVEVDMSKAVWITGYETFTSYMDFEEEKTVDISIKYPIFGGQDQTEADAMNTCMNDLTSDMEALANDDIIMEESPKKYSITSAEVSNIETNKINVILKGKLERSGKAAKDVRIRFIYDRQSKTAFVKD